MNTKYEDKIKMALMIQCDSISASETLKRRIDEEICRQNEISSDILLRREKRACTAKRDMSADRHGELEDNTMKKETNKCIHFSVKKFVIGVAAACLLLSGTIMAGKTAMYISGGRIGTYTYAEQGKAEQKLGFEVDLVESFANGYSFQEMEVMKTKAADENGNTIYDFPELDVDYARDGVSDISLYADKRPETGNWSKVPDMTDEYDGIALRYDVVTYKFVPVGYELTAEDRANMARDDYEISEGSDSVTVAQMTSVEWTKDGVYYVLLGNDTKLSGEEMLGMAKELIAAK